MNMSQWFVDTFTVKSISSTSTGGDSTFGVARTIKGRVEQKKRRVQGPSGTVVTTYDVLVTDQEVKTGDRIWLPGADTSDARQSRRLGTVTSAQDKPGSYRLYEAEFG